MLLHTVAYVTFQKLPTVAAFAIVFAIMMLPAEGPPASDIRIVMVASSRCSSLASSLNRQLELHAGTPIRLGLSTKLGQLIAYIALAQVKQRCVCHLQLDLPQPFDSKDRSSNFAEPRPGAFCS